MNGGGFNPPHGRGRRSPSPGWEGERLVRAISHSTANSAQSTDGLGMVDGRGKRRRSASPPRFGEYDRRGRLSPD